MPKPRVRRVQELDVDKIIFSDVSENNYGGKVVYLNYENEEGEKENIYLQTPKMYNSWGIHISQARDPNTKQPVGDPRYYLQLSFGAKPSHSTKTFHDLLNALDAKIMEKAKENSVAWLKVKKSKVDVLDEKYRPQIQFSRDETTLERDNKYPDSVRFKIPYDNENKVFYNTVEVYDEHGNLQNTKTIEDMQQWLTKGSKDIAVVQLSSIYFAGGNFGLSWKVVQIQAFPSEGGIKGFAICNDDDENDEQGEHDDFHDDDEEA